jgi:hypothetical protein
MAMVDILQSPGGLHLSQTTLNGVILLLIESDSDDWLVTNPGEIDGIIGKTGKK